MAIITAFQAEDGGSIPPTRSIIRTLVITRVFIMELVIYFVTNLITKRIFNSGIINK